MKHGSTWISSKWRRMKEGMPWMEVASAQTKDDQTSLSSCLLALNANVNVNVGIAHLVALASSQRFLPWVVP
jgi:hypothetical protein